MRKSKCKSSKPAAVRAANRQYGAIPIRLSRKGKPKVLLLTSRRTRRRVAPKGWPMPKHSPAETAAREAYEEAGIKGRMVRAAAVGRYRYRKRDRAELGQIMVQAYLMHVKRQLPEWPERAQRKLRWVRPDRAAALVAEPGLAVLLMRIPHIACRAC